MNKYCKNRIKKWQTRGGLLDLDTNLLAIKGIEQLLYRYLKKNNYYVWLYYKKERSAFGVGFVDLYIDSKHPDSYRHSGMCYVSLSIKSAEGYARNFLKETTDDFIAATKAATEQQIPILASFRGFENYHVAIIYNREQRKLTGNSRKRILTLDVVAQK